MPANTLLRQLKVHNPEYKAWSQRTHAQDWLLFADNVGPHLSIDEVSVSQGELYTFITNKEGKGKQGTLVGSVRGTRSADIVALLNRLSPQQRGLVEEVSMDMAKNMEVAIQTSFPQAQLVTDRYHVMALAHKQLQLLRTQLWRVCLDQENQAIEQARKKGLRYRAVELRNGDTPKQLLARSRFALFKAPQNWSPNQHLRMQLLFERYPNLKIAWQHVQDLSAIFGNTNKDLATQQLDIWIYHSLHPEKVCWDTNEIQTLAEFAPVAKSILYHKQSILNFFNHRSTNASAESFNAKIKGFRAKLKGVRDTTFFMYRIAKLFA